MKTFAGPGTEPGPCSGTEPCPLVIANLAQQVRQMKTDDSWEPFRPGVTAKWLYREPDGGPSAVFLKYVPGARVPVHEHVGYEQLFVLEGDQYDEEGDYAAGSYIVHPPGTRHSPGSRGGCIALLIYDQAVRFVE